MCAREIMWGLLLLLELLVSATRGESKGNARCTTHGLLASYSYLELGRSLLLRLYRIDDYL